MLACTSLHHRLPPDCPPPKVAAPRRPGSSRVWQQSRVEAEQQQHTWPRPVGQAARGGLGRGARVWGRQRQLALDAPVLRQLTPCIVSGQTLCVRLMRLRWKATALDFLPWTGAVLRQLTPLPLIFPPAMFSFICLLECIENIAN